MNKNDSELGKVIVALSKDVTHDELVTDYRALLLDEVDAHKAEVLYQSQIDGDSAATVEDNVGAIVLLHLKSGEETRVTNAIDRLRAKPYVVYAEPDFLMDMYIIPNDPFYKYLWGMKRVRAPSAWDYFVGSSDIVVGVLDSGIYYGHPDLKENMWIAPAGQGLYGWDFYYDNYDSMDENGHGTHVAGVIGAVGNNRVGIAGVCWNVKLASLKIGGRSDRVSVSAAVKAIMYAKKFKMPILNNSWGGRFYSSSLRLAIEHYDGLFICAAGNSGSDNDVYPIYPASYDSENIISVAAVNQNGDLAVFSNYGETSVDIAAPGASILSTFLGGEYGFKDGTSMAAPYVAGAAALIKGYRPSLTTLEIKDIILAGVDRSPRLNRRIRTGGILNLANLLA